MEKKILIAVDDSVHSNYAIQYASRLAEHVKNVRFTIFHVQPMISQYLLDEAQKDSKSRAELEKVIAKNSEVGRDLLDNLKKKMVRKGIAEEFIKPVTHTRMRGLARDILDYSQSGQFDALLMGRRGLSGIRGAIMGSVSSNILEHSKSMPVWLIDGEVDFSKILFAVDGSENSLKAVDHLAAIMGNTPDIKILFFHVQPKISDFCPIDFEAADSDRLEEIIMKGDKRCIDQFFAHALKRLKAAGFEDNQIEVKTSKALLNPGKAIIEEAKQGSFGTILIGRRGINKAFFTGSVSHYVISQMSNRAIWIVP
jgi:nucleotide-binding universal stress UspA family protein